MTGPEVIKQPCQQNRTEYAGIDLLPNQRKPFIDFIESLGLKQPKNFIPGNEATIYFLENDTPNILPGRLRFRMYGLPPFTNTFIIDSNQEGVFEMKIKPASRNRVEIKHRQTATAQMVDEFIKDPRRFQDLFYSSYSPTIQALPEDKIDPQLFEALLLNLTDTGSIFPSLIIYRNRQHWVLDENDPDTFRVTLDNEIKYFGYPYKTPQNTIFTPPTYLGDDSYLRAEIKVDNHKNQIELVDTIREWLTENGHIPPVRKKGFQVYFRHELGVPDRYALAKDYLTKEIPGREIEAKLTLESPDDRITIADLIKKGVENGDLPDYRLHQMLPHTKQTSPISYRYGIRDEKGNILGEAFIITMYSDGRIAGLKRKTNLIGQYGQHGNILDKEEVKESIRWPAWTQWAEEETIKEQAEILGVKKEQMFLGGVTKRDRIRVNIENKGNDRTYVISIEDNLTNDGRNFRQIEIEYGDRRGNHLSKIDGITIPQIVGEIEEIQKFLIDLITTRGGSLKPEPVSKFDWLTSPK